MGAYRREVVRQPTTTTWGRGCRRLSGRKVGQVTASRTLSHPPHGCLCQPCLSCLPCLLALPHPKPIYARCLHNRPLYITYTCIFNSNKSLRFFKNNFLKQKPPGLAKWLSWLSTRLGAPGSVHQDLGSDPT